MAISRSLQFFNLTAVAAQWSACTPISMCALGSNSALPNTKKTWISSLLSDPSYDRSFWFYHECSWVPEPKEWRILYHVAGGKGWNCFQEKRTNSTLIFGWQTVWQRRGSLLWQMRKKRFFNERRKRSTTVVDCCPFPGPIFICSRRGT